MPRAPKPVISDKGINFGQLGSVCCFQPSIFCIAIDFYVCNQQIEEEYIYIFSIFDTTT